MGNLRLIIYFIGSRRFMVKLALSINKKGYHFHSNVGIQNSNARIRNSNVRIGNSNVLSV